MDDIHSCSYYCTRPGCVLAQRDELRDGHGAGNQVPPTAQPAPPPMEQDAMGIAMVQAWDRDGYSGNDDAVHPTFQRGFTAGWLAAQPAAQPVQRLSDARIDEICRQGDFYSGTPSWLHFDVTGFARAIEAALQPQGWQPIETAPKDGQEFVTANSMQGFVKELVSWNRIHGYWQSKGKSIHMQATHWMPLPARPGGAS